MSETAGILLGTVPAILVVLFAVVYRRAGPEETAGRRSLLFLEITTLVVFTGLALFQIIPENVLFGNFWISEATIPVLFGTAILIVVNLTRPGQLSKNDKIVIAALGAANTGFIIYYLREPSSLVILFLLAITVLGAAWLVTRKPSRWVWLLVALILPLWCVFNLQLERILNNPPRIVSILLDMVGILSPALTVAVMAVLVHTGMQLVFPAAGEAAPSRMVPDRVDGFLRLVAAPLLLGVIAYSVFWASVWDQTSDGMTGLGIYMMTGLVGVASGMVMSWQAAGWRRLVGIGFLVAIPLLVSPLYHLGWHVKFPAITEQRATRVTQALAQFQSREHHYPKDLVELVPRDLLFIPQPVMFRGESWCYTGSASAFALAAFHHEYFGLPVSLHVYASEGSLGDDPLPCQDRLADMQALYDWTHTQMVPTTEDSLPPTPIPASQEPLVIK